MKWKNDKREFTLDGTGIDNCSAYLDHMLEMVGMERQNRIRIRFSMEELLLRYRDRVGSGHRFYLTLYRRLRNPCIQIELEADMYNPLNQQESELEDWSMSVLNNINITPQFVYNSGRNIIRFVLPAHRMNPVLRIAIAIVIGILVGILLQEILPDESEEFFRLSYITPFYNLWMRILNLISGPVIFLMTVTTVVGIGRLSGKGANGIWVIGRYFLITFGIAAFTVFIVSILSGMDVYYQSLDRSTVYVLLDEIFSIVPKDVIHPFINAETPQLILTAFVLGTILNILRDQVPNLIKVIKQLNAVGMLLTEWISWLVPIFTCILLILEIEENQNRMLLYIWKPLVSAVLLVVVVVACAFVYTSLRKHVPVRVLLAKTIRPFLTTLKTGSLSDSYGQVEISCVSQMGMDKEFTEISFSHGLVLYMPANIIGALTFTIFTASYYSVQITWVWYLAAVVLVVILMEAAPPVPGVSLLVYIVIFGLLVIPQEALIPAMVFDIVFSILATAANQMMLQLEMIFQADRMGLINRERLRKPL